MAQGPVKQALSLVGYFKKSYFKTYSSVNPCTADSYHAVVIKCKCTDSFATITAQTAQTRGVRRIRLAEAGTSGI